MTPEHWKAASRKLIKLTDYEKIEEEKKARDEEIKRRIEERKKRHEAMAKGDSKKPFYELSQENIIASTGKVELQQPNQEGHIIVHKYSNDPNALDYEVDEEELRNKRNEIIQKETKKRDFSNLLRKKSPSKGYERDNRDRRTKPHFQKKYRRSKERENRRSRSKNRYFNRNFK